MRDRQASHTADKIFKQRGSYEGFDIVKSGITWCQKKITKSHPNFTFKHIDLKNELYNLSTDSEAKDFVFPYTNDDFDVVFLFSVFSHMMPDDVDNYLKQIHRVLKNGSKCFATFFILNDESKKHMDSGQGLKFNFDMGDHVLHDKNVKEANVAYKEDVLKAMITESKLKIEAIHYGWWSGRNREKCVGYQDVVILSK